MVSRTNLNVFLFPVENVVMSNDHEQWSGFLCNFSFKQWFVDCQSKDTSLFLFPPHTLFLPYLLYLILFHYPSCPGLLMILCFQNTFHCFSIHSFPILQHRNCFTGIFWTLTSRSICFIHLFSSFFCLCPDTLSSLTFSISISSAHLKTPTCPSKRVKTFKACESSPNIKSILNCQDQTGSDLFSV